MTFTYPLLAFGLCMALLFFTGYTAIRFDRLLFRARPLSTADFTYEAAMAVGWWLMACGLVAASVGLADFARLALIGGFLAVGAAFSYRHVLST